MQQATTLMDLYLVEGCARPPDLRDLLAYAPFLAEPPLQARLHQRFPSPGFLGLNLPPALATTLLARLSAAGARGESVPAAYRAPRVSREQAQAIAERALPQEAARVFPGYPFGPVLYWRAGPRWWVFGCASERLVEEGHIPGGVLAYVDTLDGHLWSFEDMQRLQPQ